MNQALKEVVVRAERIYRERYQAEYEKSHLGRFGVIEVESSRIFVAETPEDAYRSGLRELPQGKFYLLKIGAAGVYRVGYSRCDGDRGDRQL